MMKEVKWKSTMVCVYTSVVRAVCLCNCDVLLMSIFKLPWCMHKKLPLTKLIFNKLYVAHSFIHSGNIHVCSDFTDLLWKAFPDPVK